MDVYTRKLKSHQKGIWDSIDTNTSNSGFLEFQLLYGLVNSGFGINEVRYYREIVLSTPQAFSSEKNLRSILWEALLIVPPKERAQYLASLENQIEAYGRGEHVITRDCTTAVMEITNRANLRYLRRQDEERKNIEKKNHRDLVTKSPLPPEFEKSELDEAFENDAATVRQILGIE